MAARLCTKGAVSVVSRRRGPFFPNWLFRSQPRSTIIPREVPVVFTGFF